MLIAGIILLLVGVSVVIVGIVLLVNASNVPDDNAIARGSVGGRPIAFDREDDGEITVYLRSTSSDMNVVHDQVRDTTCAVDHGGVTSTIDGSGQSFSITLGNTGTIGSVHVTAGAVTVTCEGSSSDGEEVIVARGGPPGIVPGLVFVFAGIGLFIVGVVLTIVGVVLRSRRRRRAPPPSYASG